MIKKKYCYDYPRPAVTVDLIIISETDASQKILLIERKNQPFKGMWALPGGFVDENEDLPDAAMRELKEETDIDNVSLIQIGAFGKPGRDPRGHTVAVAFMAQVNHKIPVNAGDDASNVQWFPIEKLPNLAFDHKEIIEKALFFQKQKKFFDI